MVEVLDRVGEYITLPAAARKMGVKSNTLYQWLRREGKPLRMVGRVLLVRMDEVQDYEQYRSR